MNDPTKAAKNRASDKTQAARFILNVLRSPLSLMSRPTREEALELAKRFEITAADLIERAVNQARDT